MRLADLNPRFVGSGGTGVTYSDTGLPVPRREGIGLGFDCPCGCASRVFVYFANPLDGGPSASGLNHSWNRTGMDFDKMTLTPSILRCHPGSCGWHGFVTDGEIITC